MSAVAFVALNLDQYVGGFSYFRRKVLSNTSIRNNMIDKNSEIKARKLLPAPETSNEFYIDIKVPLKNGKYEIVTFAKSVSDGKTCWIALPYAR